MSSAGAHARSRRRPAPGDEALSRLPEEWKATMAALGHAAYRGDQVFRWIHQRGVVDPAAMTDLSKALRTSLASELDLPLQTERVHEATDGTRKLLVRLGDAAPVETVLLPAQGGAALHADASTADHDDDDDVREADVAKSGRRRHGRSPRGRHRPRHRRPPPSTPSQTMTDRDPAVRVTQCISTQVGCAMGCVFCASGVAGLTRHMTPGEIVGQVLLGRRHLQPGEAIRNVVFMGMGEPLHNFEGTVRAIELLTHPDGLGLSPRRITVSTSGLIPEIERLGARFEGRVGLAISLHQPDDARRSALMPINRKYPLPRLVEALRAYPLPRGRKITIEYTLVAGQNDRDEDADRLARLLRGLRVKINLIPMNPIEASRLGPPPPSRVDTFQRRLQRAGYLCFVRRRRGDDVAAACGQLAMIGKKPNRAFERRQPAG
ncbi:MAG: 23S rRNA (adenine(2503)-C(2))-methyltransferase RlmN [Myxococcota bacterium]